MAVREGPTGVKQIVVSGQTFECTAKPCPWPYGLRIQIDVTKAGKRIGCVLVLCASNQAALCSLSSLSPSELCDLALSRFVAGDLSVTLERVLWWQAEIGKLGYD